MPCKDCGEPLEEYEGEMCCYECERNEALILVRSVFGLGG